MIKIKKYAAIDIGSNAMRLLIANIVEEEGKETTCCGVVKQHHSGLIIRNSRCNSWLRYHFMETL